MRLAARQTIDVVAFAVVPLALAAFFLLTGGEARAFDFHQFWQGGRDVLEGVSPYPTATPVVDGGRSLTPQEIQDVFRFPYPAPTAFAMAPLALLPFAAASSLLLALLVLAVPGTLYMLGVRDWRCYGAAFLWIPVLAGIRIGSLTPLLVLGLAVAWRYRDRPWIASPVIAAIVVAKLFLWPLLFWLLAVRRTGTAAAAAGVGASSALLAWAALGFAGLADYPELLRRLADAVQYDGYSIVALGIALGAGDGLSGAASVALGLAVLGVAVLAARRRPADEGTVFALVLVAALVLSPIVWLHYFALLLVPVAIASPRFSPLWLLPLGFWLIPYQESDGELWRILLALALLAAAVGAALSRVGGRSLIREIG